MNKAEFITKVEAKDGYVRTISDALTNDSPVGDTQKRFLLIETTNTDGTAGITNVFYMLDTVNDVVKFYNVEPVSFDTATKSVPQQTIDALDTYCKATFDAYFLIPDRIDAENKWAVVEAYMVQGADLVKSNVMVFKKGTSPIAHLTIV